MGSLGFTINADRTEAYCHYCALVLRRSSDPVGLLLAADHHVTRRH
jgi:hypothetical protein